MQAVILCGGLGTRLGPLTRDLPKSLVPVAGKPFIHYQLSLLRHHGVRHVVLCIGHLGQAIRETVGDGRAWGLEVAYSDEGERLLGTAGAVKRAAPLLHEVFFVKYGDSYLPIPYAQVWAAFERSGKPAMMVVYRNANAYDQSNVVLHDGMVQDYNKSNPAGKLYIDAGVTVLRKEVLNLVPDDAPSSLEALFSQLVRARGLAAFETEQRFYEVGSVRGLEEFRDLVAAGEVAQ